MKIPDNGLEINLEYSRNVTEEDWVKQLSVKETKVYNYLQKT